MSKENPENNLQVSAVQDFKQRAVENKKGRLLQLKSGLVVKVGQPDISVMITNGQLPTDLIGIALNQEASGKVDNKDIPQFFKFQNVMVQTIVMQPKISDNPKEDELSIDDLTLEDKMEIFKDWSEQGKTLNKFRKGQSTDDQDN